MKKTWLTLVAILFFPLSSAWASGPMCRADRTAFTPIAMLLSNGEIVFLSGSGGEQ